MSKEDKIQHFDPNGVGLKNGHFIGLPFDEKDASIVLVSVPWDATVSYGQGTSEGPDNILDASTQLDLFDPDIPDAWKMGIYMRPSNTYWKNRNTEVRPHADAYIEFLENGGKVEEDKKMQKALTEINQSSLNLKNWVYEQTSNLLKEDKLVGIVGGEHSVPLGFLEALAARHDSFGILQIDAHMDLREAYEGFTYSHASIFYNALPIKAIEKLVQVGIRDYCEAEWNLAQKEGNRIEVHTDQSLSEMRFEGLIFEQITDAIIRTLPDKVYISFDIDGLKPQLCPHTGTPVPGGLDMQEAFYLIKKVVDSGRTIIGFDLCEVAGPPHEWDGNVGARVLYRLANWMGVSNRVRSDE